MESSTFIAIPKEKLEQAESIVIQIENKIENSEDGYVGFTSEIRGDGIWVYDIESFNPEHAEILIKALVDKLELPGIHVCSWAYTCSKPRTDEFGGGEFAVQSGQETIWIDAANDAEDKAKQLSLWKN